MLAAGLGPCNCDKRYHRVKYILWRLKGEIACVVWYCEKCGRTWREKCY